MLKKYILVVFCCCSAAAGSADDVVDRYQNILEKNPKGGAVFDRVYQHYLETGSIDTLITVYKKRAETENDYNVWLLYALFLQRQNKNFEAIKAFQQAAKLDSQNYLPMYELGNTLLAAQQYREGLAAMEQGLQRLRQSEVTGKQLRDVLLKAGQTFTRFGEQNKANEVWQQLEALFPDDSEVLIQIAESLENIGKKNEAVQRYQKLIANNDDDYERVRLTLKIAELSPPDKTLPLLSQLLDQLDSNTDTADTVRQNIERTLTPEQTAAFYRKRLGEYPNESATLQRLITFLKPSESEVLLTDAVEKNPGNTALRLTLANVLTEQKKYEAAIRQYEAVDKIEPNNIDVLTFWGQLYLDKERNAPVQEQDTETSGQNALNIWQRISSDAPDDAVAATAVADLCSRSGFMNEAETYYRKAFELKPEDFAYREHLAKYYYAMKNKKKTLEVLIPPKETELYDERQIFPIAKLLLSMEFISECIELIGTPDDDLSGIFIEALVKRGTPADIKRAAALFAQQEQKCETDKQFAELLKREIAMRIAVADDLPDTYRSHWKQAAYEQSLLNLSAASASVSKALNTHTSPELMVFAADLYVQSGDIKKASELYQTLAKEQEYRSEALQKLAALQVQSGALNEALETSKSLLSSGGVSNVKYYAELLSSTGRKTEAVDAVRQGLRQEPGNTDLLQMLAKLLNGLGQTDEAFEISYRQWANTRDLTGKLAVLDTMFNAAPLRSDEILKRLRTENRSPDIQFCIAKVLSTTENSDEARRILETLTGTKTVPLTLTLGLLVSLCEQQGDIAQAVHYQEQLCRSANAASEQEHLFRLYEKSGDEEKADKLFLDLVLRTGTTENKLPLIDAMIRRGKYDTVLRTLDFLDIHEPENWQLPFRRLIVLFLQKKPFDISEIHVTGTSKSVPHHSAAAITDFQYANIAPAAFMNSLKFQYEFVSNAVNGRNITQFLDEVQTYQEAKFIAAGLQLADALRKNAGKNTFAEALESWRERLPMESGIQDKLLERLTLEITAANLYGGFRGSINFSETQMNITRLVRKLGLSNAAGWDTALFQILLTESVNVRIIKRFEQYPSDAQLKQRCAAILEDYAKKNGLPALPMPQIVSEGVYRIKTARTMMRYAEQDEPLTQEKRNHLLMDIWNRPAQRHLFETFILPQYAVLKLVVDSGEFYPNGQISLFLVNELTDPVDDDWMLFPQLRQYEPLTKHWQRMKPMFDKAGNADEVFTVLQPLLYKDYLYQYDIFQPHERELVGETADTIRQQLQNPAQSNYAVVPNTQFAKQLFGYEPYPVGSQRTLTPEQIKRIVELDNGIQQLINFAVGMPAAASEKTLTPAEPQLSKYQNELSGSQPVSKKHIAELIGNIHFADTSTPREDFFFKVAMLYRALDTKTKFILVQQDGGVSPVRHDYFDTFVKRIERLQFSTAENERELAAEIVPVLNNLLKTSTQLPVKNAIAVLEYQLAVKKRTENETLALALCKTARQKYNEVLPLLDSLTLSTPQDNKAREWVAVNISRKNRQTSNAYTLRLKIAVERLLNYRLTDKEMLQLLDAMPLVGMNDGQKEQLDRLILSADDRKLQADVLTAAKKYGYNDSAERAALRILENPAFLDNPRRITADLYVLENAVGVIKDEKRITDLLEPRFRSNRNAADGKLLSAKLYVMLGRMNDAKQLLIELSQDPPTEPERRQLTTSLLVQLAMQKELDTMNKLLTEKYNRQ